MSYFYYHLVLAGCVTNTRKRIAMRVTWPFWYQFGNINRGAI